MKETKTLKSKFIFITGGVCSSLGKGIAAASIGMLLKASDLKVFVMKMDPYLNVDPGTMNPAQHGEVFVSDDGAETDLDLGHYERMLNQPVTKLSSVSSGQIFNEVSQKERKGDFLGETIQIVPHITNAIKIKILTAAETSGADVVIVEIGGTVGDIEGESFLEAIRQLRDELPVIFTLSVHLTLIVHLESSNELKTKPTQRSVSDLKKYGIRPDIILARADKEIPEDLLNKISKFCGVPLKAVIPAPTVKNIYEIPLNFQKGEIVELIGEKLKFNLKPPNLNKWENLIKRIKNAKNPESEIKIAIVGKYFDKGADVYISVVEALKHAAWHFEKSPIIDFINSEDIEANGFNLWNLKKYDGVVVPGGFGARGTEGIINAIRFCRENKIPFLGLCFGMQLAVVEFARNVADLDQAHTTEINPKTKHPVIDLMLNQKKVNKKGGTMRLGKYPCCLNKKSISRDCYNTETIEERHRHRYEFNNKYREVLEKFGLVIAGVSPNQELVEIIELSNEEHSFFVGVQFHPEFLSRPLNPHPLFRGFIKAVIKK